MKDPIPFACHKELHYISRERVIWNIPYYHPYIYVKGNNMTNTFCLKQLTEMI